MGRLPTIASSNRLAGWLPFHAAAGLCLLAALWGAAVAEDGVEASARRPRIGLALSGGGARGLAEVGVLRALEEAGIPIDCIAGTSMGAVVGGLYAAGVSVDSLDAIGRQSELFSAPASYSSLSLFQKRIVRPRAFALYFSGWEYRLPRSLMNDFRVNWMLIENATPANLAAGGDFDRLPIPFRTLALDLYSGQVQVFRSGDLARAIRASMSVPVAFPPMAMRDPDRLLVDAGPKNNLPVEQLKEMGCDKIIAVNCASSWTERDISDDVTRVALELVRILSQKVDSTSIRGWDVWIEPDLEGTRVNQFDHVDAVVEAGYQATWAQMDRIRALFPDGSPPPPPRRPDIREISASLRNLRISRIALEGRRMSFGWVPTKELGLTPGDRFAMPALGRGLLRLYATDHYASVWPSVTRADSGQVVVHLDLEEREPTYVSVGLLYDNRRNMNLNVEIARDNLLRLGESIYTSFFLGTFYSGLEAGVRSSHIRNLPLVVDLLARSDVIRYRQGRGQDFTRKGRLLQISTGVLGGRHSLLLGGVRLERDRGQNGEPRVEDWDHTNRIAFGTLMIDATDERILPTRGLRARLEYQIYLERVSGVSLQTFSADVLASLPAGRFFLTPAGEVKGITRRDQPFRLWNRLDLSRATVGRFETGLYSPYVASASLMGGCRLATNLTAWSTGTAGLQGQDWKLLQRDRPGRGLEGGVLQRTPIGPVLLGVALERMRNPFYFIQVGYDWIPPR